MSDIFQNLNPLNEKIYLRQNENTETLLGQIIPKTDYESADIVILGFSSDEGINRSGGRIGSALAPDEIRKQFYQLTPFSFSVKVCDLGNLNVSENFEQSCETFSEISQKILADGKKIVVLGGGNDIAYPCGKAMAKVFGSENWLGVNINSNFDVNDAGIANNKTAFRQLLNENLLRPQYFYAIGFQRHFISTENFLYLQNLGANLSSLEQIRSRETADLELREMMRLQFINHSKSLNTCFNFSLNAVRAADAPGTNNPSPLGLRAGEFIQLVKFAASLTNTKIIQFTEINPNFDRDNQTALLTAIAMHRFCTLQPKI